MSNDEVIVLDSDDEQQAVELAKSYSDNPVFEDEEHEYEASSPDDPVIQELDLPFGAEVLHISFPTLPSELHRAELESLPRLLSTDIIIGASCSDLSLRIISVPITPPSPHSKARPELRTRIAVPHSGRGPFGERMLVIPNAAGHQSIPKGISITLTSKMLQSVEDVLMTDVDQDVARRYHDQPISAPGGCSWEILVALHSDDLSGLLLIHRIPIKDDTIGSVHGFQELNYPWQMQNLTSPAMSVSFNPSRFPAPRHSQLLVVESRRAIRIFDCKPQSDSDQGSWLYSIYPSFQTSTDCVPKRKQILDAQWVLGGKAVVALLTDGEWGVWDLENAGPKAKGISDCAPPGGSSLAFTISGWIGSFPASKSLFKTTGGRKDDQARLAPMTPGTRRTRQQALFSGSSTAVIPQAYGPSGGGLSVSAIHSLANRKVDDDTLLVWYRESITVIPSLLTYWQNKRKESGNLFGAGVKGLAEDYNNIDLGGEVRNNVSIFPVRYRRNETADRVDPLKILITGEHRLVIVAPLLEPPVPASVVPLQTHSRPTDQHLLVRGELDMDGMDRILSNMPNGAGGSHRNGVTPLREVDSYPL